MSGCRVSVSSTLLWRRRPPLPCAAGGLPGSGFQVDTTPNETSDGPGTRSGISFQRCPRIKESTDLTIFVLLNQFALYVALQIDLTSTDCYFTHIVLMALPLMYNILHFNRIYNAWHDLAKKVIRVHSEMVEDDIEDLCGWFDTSRSIHGASSTEGRGMA